MSGRTTSRQPLRIWFASAALALAALIGGVAAITSPGKSVEQPEPVVNLTLVPARKAPPASSLSPSDVSIRSSLSL